MSDAAQPAACAPAAVPEPPAWMVEAAELAMAEHLVRWSLSMAPAALRTLATDAIKAARGAALERMHGARHGDAGSPAQGAG